MFPFFDSDVPQEDIQLLATLLSEAQKHSHQAQFRWEATVKRVIVVLQDWFEAMEQAVANHRHPTIDCTVTDEKANLLIDVIDSAFTNEITKYPEYWANRKQVDAPPQFSRLELDARKALAEDLRRVLEEAKSKIAR